MKALLMTALVAGCAVQWGCQQDQLLAEERVREEGDIQILRTAQPLPSQVDRLRAKWPETRALSFLHAKSQEGVVVGQWAAKRGTTDEIRNFGLRMTNDMVAIDDRVLSEARKLNLSLVPPAEIMDIIAAERGDTPLLDASAMETLSGSEFDYVLMLWAQSDRRMCVEVMYESRSQVGDGRVRDLLFQTIPVFRRQESTATYMLNKMPRY
ncbi:MAG: DUF4142 domain-containing protein [Phycisphaerales bacterium]